MGGLILSQAFITGLAQLITLIATVWISKSISTEAFGLLMVTVSLATALSAIISMQIERVYVKISNRRVAEFFAMHISAIAMITIVLSTLAYLIYDADAILMAGAIACNQATNYYLARVGRFRRLWALKAAQAFTLSAISFTFIYFEADEYLTIAFTLSWIISAALVWQKQLYSTIKLSSIHRFRRHLLPSVRLGLTSMVTMQSVSFMRELPVLLAGLVGLHEVAGALALANRILGQPIGLIARSTSAVIAKTVSAGELRHPFLIKLTFIPICGIVLSVLAYSTIRVFDILPEYPSLSQSILAIFLFVCATSYSGSLGSAYIYYSIYGTEAWQNLISAIVLSMTGALIWMLALPIEILPVLAGILMSISAAHLTIKLYAELKNERMHAEGAK